MAITAPPVIAIDGPSASGKGTVAQSVARTLGFNFLNSGALYRTVALAALRLHIDLDSESRLASITLKLNANFSGDVVELDGEDVTDAIRTEAVSAAASRIAAHAAVRRALLQRQRAFRQPPGLVADGRDMGTVVFPDATLKIFLTASVAERAARRYKQLMEKGMSATMAALLQELKERDARDEARAVAPLQRGTDAVLIDTTQITAAEVVAQVLALYQQAPRAP